MSTQDPNAPNVGDQNVERLIGQAYKPEQPDAGLLPRVTEQMCGTAGKHAAHATPASGADETRRLVTIFTGMAVTIAGLLLIFHAVYPPSRSGHSADRTKKDTTIISKSINPDGSPSQEGMKPRAKPIAAPIRIATVGDNIQTGERGLRVPLPDGSVLYVNRQSVVRLDADRRIVLIRGEVFADVAPKPKDSGKQFVIVSGEKEVKALGTKFAVRTNENGKTGVVVTQGEVQVTGYDQPIAAGQQLHEVGKDDRPTTAPRVSHVLDWTRELMAAADSPLVPESKYTGGALVAVDPSGQEAKLSLRKYHVNVHIEDGFARTIIDQTYFNAADLRMEGTFYFPLPADASLSRLAMYVEGNLMEGGMAERDYARNVYEEIMYSQKDPALLEWVDGSTFKMRVFPLEARQEKRIIIGYTQRLSSLYGQSQYRFPAGHSLGLVQNWSLHARVKGGQACVVSSDSHQLKQTAEGGDVLLDAALKDARLDRDVTLNVVDPTGGGPGQSATRFSTSVQDGSRYVMLRHRPELATQKQRQHRDWVFLFEASGDRDPLLARAQIEVIRDLLANAEYHDKFAVLTAGTRVRTFRPDLVDVNAENVKAAIDFLESSHLIGALDLNQALTEADSFLRKGQNSHLVHVGSGIAALGERRPDVLAKKLPQNARYVGVGVGKRWSRPFMKAAAERSGGYYTQINPDEPISWRTFDLAATLNTPRLLDLKVLGNTTSSRFLLHANSLAQGEEVCAVARFGAEEPLPTKLTVIGSLDGAPFQEEIDLTKQMPEAGHLPRTWAKLELDRLLTEDAQKHRDTIIAMSKQMYVMTPFTSLLVLENDEMYQRFKVDRGRKDHWASYVTPQTIKVVYEPLGGQPVDPRFAPKQDKPHANQVRQSIVVRGAVPILTWPGRQEQRSFGPMNRRMRADATFAEAQSAGFPGELENGERGIDRDETRSLNLGQLERAIFDEERESPAKSREIDGLMMNGRNAAPGRRDLARLGLRTATSARFRRESYDDMLYETEKMEKAAGEFQTFGLAAAMPRSPALKDMPSGGSGTGGVNEFFKFQQDASKSMSVLRQIPLVRDQKTVRQYTEQLAARIVDGQSQGPRMYGRPAFSHDDRVFIDLVTYAPGMNTSRADIDGVVEAEAAPGLANLPGVIDPEARPLIEQARKAGWQILTVNDADGKPLAQVAFDGQGRYTYERSTPMGLREEVICDGKTILHLYPELGIGARRPLSRFHRAEFAQLVPWLLAPIEDLARGVDIKKIGERTVSLVPHGAAGKKDDDGKLLPYAATHLIFAADGRLIERRIVDNTFVNNEPKVETLFVETYSPAGVVKLTDGANKELSKRELKLSATQQPNLERDVSKLVVLPMPWRTSSAVYNDLKINGGTIGNGNEDWTLAYLGTDEALQLLAAEFADSDTNRFRRVHRRCFLGNGVNKLGFYTLLAAMNVPVATDPEFRKLFDEDPANPLARYLAVTSNPMYQALQRRWNIDLGTGVGPENNLFQRLAAFRDLDLRWQYVSNNTRHESRERDQVFRKGLEFVTRNKTSVLGWAMLSTLQDRAEERFQRDVANAWKQFVDGTELGYVAQYEHARSLFNAKQTAEAAKLYRELYERTLKAHMLPPLDHSFRQALLHEGKGADDWTPLLQQTAQALLKDKLRTAVVSLAWQCWQLGDAPLAENLLVAALKDPTDDTERLQVTIAACDYLLGSGQDARADSLVTPLLDNAELAKRPVLWRLAARIAERRQQTARSIAYLEKAVEIEFQNLPEVVNLKRVRQDYNRLLNHYERLAFAVATMKIDAPPDLAARTIRAADRWRALDRDNAEVCNIAARILQTLGAREMAWDYLTTPIGMRPNEAGPWRNLAERLSHQGDLDLSDLAFRAAFDAEPTDAQLLWDRAQNLKRAGKGSDAQQVLRDIANGNWQPRFAWLKSQARWQLEGR